MDAQMLVLTYTETMTMPAVMLDALIYAVSVKQRVRRETKPTG